jgi:hypothetical protein
VESLTFSILTLSRSASTVLATHDPAHGEYVAPVLTWAVTVNNTASVTVKATPLIVLVGSATVASAVVPLASSRSLAVLQGVRR